MMDREMKLNKAYHISAGQVRFIMIMYSSYSVIA